MASLRFLLGKQAYSFHFISFHFMILLSFYLIEVFTLIKQKYGSDIFKFFFYVIFRFYIKRNYLTFCFIFSPGLPVITDLIQNRCFNPKSFLFQSGLPTSLWVCLCAKTVDPPVHGIAPKSTTWAPWHSRTCKAFLMPAADVISSSLVRRIEVQPGGHLSVMTLPMSAQYSKTQCLALGGTYHP